ncbi:MAG: acyltransferase [Variovorax sp.]
MLPNPAEAQSLPASSFPPAAGVPQSSVRRDPWVDCLKAIAIIGVVYIHAGAPLGGLFRFGVPVFLGFWAFYTERALMRLPAGGQRRYLTRRFLAFLIPYLFWTGLYLAIFFRADGEQSHGWRFFSGWFGGYGWAGQYYFLLLFQLIVLMPGFRRLVTPKSILPLLAVSMLLDFLLGLLFSQTHMMSVLGYRLSVFWLPYLFIGVALARGMLPPLPMPALGLLAMMLLLMPLEQKHLVFDTIYLAGTGEIASLLLLWWVLGGRRGATPKPDNAAPTVIERTVAWIGRNTFPIFVLNPMALALLHRIAAVPAWLLRHPVVGPLVLVPVAILVCLALGEILKRLRLGVLVGDL